MAVHLKIMYKIKIRIIKLLELETRCGSSELEQAVNLKGIFIMNKCEGLR